MSWAYAPHELSEHPAEPAERKTNPAIGDVTAGMQWTLEQIDAVARGGLWKHTAIFVTWDDWGGWYDHVNPPLAEKWRDGSQFRFGRIACLVIGPYAKRGYVSKRIHSHVSIVRFCAWLFGIEPFNARLAAADHMADCFDFHHAARPAPVLPQAGQRAKETGVLIAARRHWLRRKMALRLGGHNTL